MDRVARLAKQFQIIDGAFELGDLPEEFPANALDDARDLGAEAGDEPVFGGGDVVAERHGPSRPRQRTRAIDPPPTTMSARRR